MKKGAVQKLVLGTVVACSFLFSSNAYANIICTRLIDTSYAYNMWYDWTAGSSSGKISFNSTTIGGGKLYTQDNVYTLDVTGTFTFTPNLARDYSSGGLAKGYFDGGVTVTITGGLKLNGSYVYGGTDANVKQILSATLTPVYEDSQSPTSNRWAFEEGSQEVGRFDKTLFLQFVAGSEGLATGIQLSGTTDTLIMVTPQMDLSLKASGNPNNFVTGDFNSGITPSNVKFTPEPVTLALFGIGALLVRRRK
jgi:hypothetical protein